MMKRIPLSIADFAELINGGYVYIDKTPFIHSLLTTNKYYFLSRPRRFGKSLLVTTLHEIFQGNKELFKDTHIYKSEYSWESYPVIFLDFGLIPHKTPQILEEALKRYLHAIAEKNGVVIETPSLEEGLTKLVEKLYQKTGKRIAILVDEYDRAISRNLDNRELALSNQDVLQGFFTALKSLGKYLHFIFITGVSKFAQGSLFSGLNIVQDITMEEDYATLVGYTEQEMVFYLD